MLRPCVRCLGKKIKRQRSGVGRCFSIIQCEHCGFNVTAYRSFAEAVTQWNGFKVWNLVKEGESKCVCKTQEVT